MSVDGKDGKVVKSSKNPRSNAIVKNGDVSSKGKNDAITSHDAKFDVLGNIGRIPPVVLNVIK